MSKSMQMFETSFYEELRYWTKFVTLHLGIFQQQVTHFSVWKHFSLDGLVMQAEWKRLPKQTLFAKVNENRPV